MEVVQPILIPCLFTTLAGQGLILARKLHFHASTQLAIPHLTSIQTLTLLPILMRYPASLPNLTTSLTETTQPLIMTQSSRAQEATIHTLALARVIRAQERLYQ